MKSICFKLIILIVLILGCPILIEAQIGYQVALINNATGEPRALETVSVELTISNNEGTTIFSGIQSGTTNDFGILSLSVGNENTFKNVDWAKLPLYISAKVDGILIGKTQILNVPVAEYAKRTGVLTVEKLCEKPFSWQYTYSASHYNYTLSFSDDFTGLDVRKLTVEGKTTTKSLPFRWYLDGNSIIIVYNTQSDEWGGEILKYIPEINSICFDHSIYSH